ncbi:MAG TPA: imidazole glycerol phosphate synthase cyclase subunit, partial [Flavobacteriaceae bacterium]|nr:imidazole glycerol phosphate synthase cyclase subunit [Flavobacteriaceae bacterium]
MDAVASLYDRNNLSDIIKKACEEIFIPITVGGGIRTINDIENCLDSGADKVAINTQAIKDINFIKEF